MQSNGSNESYNMQSNGSNESYNMQSNGSNGSYDILGNESYDMLSNGSNGSNGVTNNKKPILNKLINERDLRQGTSTRIPEYINQEPQGLIFDRKNNINGYDNGNYSDVNFQVGGRYLNNFSDESRFNKDILPPNTLSKLNYSVIHNKVNQNTYQSKFIKNKSSINLQPSQHSLISQKPQKVLGQQMRYFNKVPEVKSNTIADKILKNSSKQTEIPLTTQTKINIENETSKGLTNPSVSLKLIKIGGKKI